jgi:hypothetical protein
MEQPLRGAATAAPRNKWPSPCVCLDAATNEDTTAQRQQSSWSESVESRISWNGGTTHCVFSSAPGNRNGERAAHRCFSRAPRMFSPTCSVPIGHRPPQSGSDGRDDDSLIYRPRVPQDPSQIRQGLLRAGHNTCRARKCYRISRIVCPAAGTNLLPRRLRFTRYEAWMRCVLVLWWVELLLGITTYTRWYIPLLFHK